MARTEILNERKEAERILAGGDAGARASDALPLLARYFRQALGLTPRETEGRLGEFMAARCPGYSPVRYGGMIESLARKGAARPLRELDGIGVTAGEMASISSLPGESHRRLLFTMLCHAKLYDALSEKNGGWVNVPARDLFREARVPVRRREERYLYLNDLGAASLISFAKRVDNLNVRVTFAERGGTPAVWVGDFRELGYEYMAATGDRGIARCARCGRPFRKSGNRSKYCAECRAAARRDLERARKAASRKDVRK